LEATFRRIERTSIEYRVIAFSSLAIEIKVSNAATKFWSGATSGGAIMRRMTDAAPTGSAEPKDPKLYDPWLDRNGVLKYWGGDEWVPYRSPPEQLAGQDPAPPLVEKKAADGEGAVEEEAEAFRSDEEMG
jgi:hypothetical protein